jgi:hypothetical protein
VRRVVDERRSTHRFVVEQVARAAATGIKKPTDTRMSSGQTEKLIDNVQAHLSRSKLSSLTSDVDELS